MKAKQFQHTAKAIALENTRAVQNQTQALLQERLREKSEEQERIEASYKQETLKPRELRKYSPEYQQAKTARI